MAKVSLSTARKALQSILLLVIIGVSGFTGFSIGKYQAEPSTSIPSIVKNGSRGPQSLDFGLFWQAWNVIDSNYYGETDDDKRLNGAIAGMVAGLGDPYTQYFEPRENELFQSDLEGNFGGIGAELSLREELLTIVSVLEGTPAERAKLKAQDIIAEIDGQKAIDYSLDEAIGKIRGPKGTDVVLTIVRKGQEEPLKITITRDTIVIKSVKTEELRNGQIAYIKINQFGQDTVELVRSALQDARRSNKKGIVVDLRNDPGGYLDAAVEVSGMLLPSTASRSEESLRDRVIVTEKQKNGKETVHKAQAAAIVPDIPLVVVVNGGSASASEIVAGAMKDYQRAQLVGVKTFGKGSVQDLIDLKNGGSIKVTVAKWFTPLGTGIDGKGIEPDVSVSLPDDVQASSSDPQITKALEVLQNQIK